MKRRTLLKLSPAALVVGATPALGGSASQPTEIQSLYREWKQIHVVLNSDDHGLADDAWDALHDSTWRICDRIMSLPSQNGGDRMAKVLVYTCDGDHELPSRKQSPMFWQEVHELVA